MDLNNARIEVCIEEITRELKAFHDQYAEALIKIDEWGNTAHIDPDQLYNLIHEAVLISSEAALQLVVDLVDQSTEEERKFFYQAQLKGIRENVRRSLEIPLKMKKVNSGIRMDQKTFQGDYYDV